MHRMKGNYVHYFITCKCNLQLFDDECPPLIALRNRAAPFDRFRSSRVKDQSSNRFGSAVPVGISDAGCFRNYWRFSSAPLAVSFGVTIVETRSTRRSRFGNQKVGGREMKKSDDLKFLVVCNWSNKFSWFANVYVDFRCFANNILGIFWN